jgi:hypothetical protein
MLLFPAQPITAKSLAHLPGFVAAHVHRVARTHGKTTWEYHHEHLPPQAFSPWLFLDELFWLYLRGSEWWLDYGGTGIAMVAAEQEGRATDTTDVWLLTDIYYEAEGEVSTFRSLLSAPSPELPDSSTRLAIDTSKLTVWRITFERDERGRQVALPVGAPQTDPAMRAMVLPHSGQEVLLVE